MGVSALLTTTMVGQKTVIEALDDMGLLPKVKVMVGGAPVTKSWAEEIGADGFSEDAMGAVTSEALSTAERAIHKVDQAIETLEHLRLELVAIAIGERWHQVERPPQIDDLARGLGELAALLQVREVLARKEG